MGIVSCLGLTNSGVILSRGLRTADVVQFKVVDMLSFALATSCFENCLFNWLSKHVFHLILLALRRRIWIRIHHSSWIVAMLYFDWPTLVEEVRRLIGAVSGG